MKTTDLKNRFGRHVGQVWEKDGKMELRDRFGKFTGTYDAKSDQTRDRFGRVVGRGNLLSSLIDPND